MAIPAKHANRPALTASVRLDARRCQCRARPADHRDADVSELIRQLARRLMPWCVVWRDSDHCAWEFLSLG